CSWMLGDGRLKCQACGTRYSSRSVWDAVRLPDPTRRRLLEAFAHGISAYSLRFEAGACVDSTERFYRLLRACCALQARISASAVQVAGTRGETVHARSMRGWSSSDTVMLVGIAEMNERVRIAAPPGRDLRDWVGLLRRHAAVGGLYSVERPFALASLPVRGSYVIARRTLVRAASEEGSAEAFWSYARSRLQGLRKIPCRYFPLYLGEMCYRFNHRGDDLASLLFDVVRSTAIQDVRELMQTPLEGMRRPGPREQLPDRVREFSTVILPSQGN
ncbi:MAG TPA: hypothetical protein VIT67_06065, partial [Povalibacter sp.]